MPTPRINAGYTWNGKELFVIGGRNRNGDVVGDIEIYRLSTNSWSKLQSLNVPREGCRAIFHQNKIYCIGGSTGLGRPVDNVEVMNLNNGMWSTATSMIAPRWLFGTQIVKNSILCIGGERAKGQTKTVDKFSARSNSWSAITDMPTACSGIDVAMANGVAVTAGGLSGFISKFVSGRNAVLYLLESMDSPYGKMHTERKNQAGRTFRQGVRRRTNIAY